MPKSTRELREICQESRDDILYKRDWFDNTFFRSVSIYFTKLCLNLGISANQASVIDLAIGIGAGVFLAFANPVFWFAGGFLFYMFFVFDCVDGEIARYNKSSSLTGAYLDAIVGFLAWPFVLGAMSYGVYVSTQETGALVLGTLVVGCWLLYVSLPMIPYHVLHQAGLLSKTVDNLEEDDMRETMFARWGRIVFGTRGLVPALFLVALIDTLVEPFDVGNTTLNARYIYLIVYAAATAFGLTLRVLNTIRNGVTIQRY